MRSLRSLLPARFRPAPEPVHERIPIPEDRILEVMEALRDWQRAPVDARSWELYQLWKVIRNAVPQIGDGRGWQLALQDAMFPEVFRRKS